MQKSTFIAIVFVAVVSIFLGSYMMNPTGMFSQRSFSVWVTGPSESQMNWGRGMNPASKTIGRAITVCTPGEKKCLTPEGFVYCQETGTSWTRMYPCPGMYYCDMDIDQCVPDYCPHGTTFCYNETHYVQCFTGLLNKDNVFECELGCDLITNKCFESSVK
ncbi:hypothetical protein GF358_01540 [Candidatus Woesearchaeota archaeon]|nr:hypothetical protein [Candidatus Woesearchaeota archaeon]